MADVGKIDLSSYDLYGARYSGVLGSLEKSSSGGVFLGVAEVLMSRGYHVCAAILTSEYKVKHIVSRNRADLEKMQGSKYTQSLLGDSFRSVKQLIKDGNKVFFCGCPCQVAGLLKYVGEADYSVNLITMDFACHGIASRKVLEGYLEWQATKKGHPLDSFLFKDKNHSWGIGGKMWRYLRLDGRLIPAVADPLAMAYLSRSNYRESCYQCQCKFENDSSDFTVGDFVRAEKFFHGTDCSEGLSLLFCKTVKAKEIWSEAGKLFWHKKIPANEYVGINQGLWYSSKRPEGRDKFYIDLDNKGPNSFFSDYLSSHLTIKKRIAALKDRCCAGFNRRTFF